jgi:CheY-like chemotaxis protein
MPKMTGFEVCEKLRRLPNYKTTPVIFVTAHSNFENRTKGVLSGGNYFIAKPIDPSELALKVTIHLFKAQVQNASRQETKPETELRMNGAPELIVPPVAPPPLAAPPPPAAPMIQANQAKNGNGKAESVVSPAAAPPVTKPYTNGTPEVIPPPVAPPPLVAPLQTEQSQNGNGNGNGNGKAKSMERPSVPLSTARPRTMDIPKKAAPQPLMPQKVASVGTTSGSRLSGSRNRNSIMNNEQDETFEKVVLAVTQIIFGDDNLTDMNVRLVRIALERYNIPEIINSPVVA